MARGINPEPNPDRPWPRTGTDHGPPDFKWMNEQHRRGPGDPDQRNGDGSGPKALSPVLRVTERCRPVEGAETPACQLSESFTGCGGGGSARSQREPCRR
jgi:hypothetical protein